MTRLAVLALLALVAAGCGGGGRTTTVTVTRTVTRTVTAPPPATTSPEVAVCTGSSLSGAFAVIRGSAGAGQIGYRLRLENTGTAPCRLEGVPSVTLLDENGDPLPTNASPAPAGVAATPVVLAAGEAATSDARFTPDVPGPGEPAAGGDQCEPTAHTLRVSVGGGSVEVPIRPPTPVCVHGRMTLTSFAPG